MFFSKSEYSSTSVSYIYPLAFRLELQCGLILPVIKAHSLIIIQAIPIVKAHPVVQSHPVLHPGILLNTERGLVESWMIIELIRKAILVCTYFWWFISSSS